MAYLIFENNYLKFFTLEDPNNDNSLIQINENSVVKEVSDDIDIENKSVTLVNNEIIIEDLEPITTSEIDILRHLRNEKLKETDMWGLRDYPATEAQLLYRQQLRDITNTFQSINDEGFSFPDKPED
tara:strand:+ start:998 stop:1378 length:381 start_codon:yes stop_codon:yes gene_type:complete